MNKFLHGDMLEAARLTKAGRLTEATAVLQRLLNRQPTAPQGTPDGTPPGHGDDQDPAPGLLSRLGHWLKGTPPAGDRAPEAAPAVARTPATAPAPAAAPRPRSGQARFLACDFRNAAGRRPYKVYVPSGYRGHPVPLIVMLHGCTQSPDDFATGTRMNAAAEHHVFLVAYPGQTSAANMQKCWNWFNADDQKRDKGEPSLIAGITREVMHDYAVDPQRVYVAGLSAGGAAAAIMANAYPDLYAAVGVHSGLACGAARDMQSAFMAMQRGTAVQASAQRIRVPAIIFHGDRDTTVNVRNGDAVAEQASGGAGLITQSNEGRNAGGHGFRRGIRIDSAGRVIVEQWTVHGGGHAWFGGDPAGSFTDPMGPDATGEMVRFFLEHPRQG